MECCRIGEPSDDILLYFMGISYKDFGDMPETDRSFVLSVHRHLQTCRICRASYEGFKANTSTECEGDDAKTIFTPEAFRLVRQNEAYLNELVSK